MNEHGVENTAVVSNPLPPDLVEKLETDEEPSPVDGPRRILSMSRLAAGKGFEQVLDAFELLDIPDVQLDIAGDGSLREMLESRAAASSARDRIHFHGWVSGEQKSELLVGARLPASWLAAAKHQLTGYWLQHILPDCGCRLAAANNYDSGCTFGKLPKGCYPYIC